MVSDVDVLWCSLKRTILEDPRLVGGDWDMAFMTFHINWEWNVIIPTVTHSIIFQRGWLKPPRSKVFPWVPENFPLWNTPRNSGEPARCLRCLRSLPRRPDLEPGPQQREDWDHSDTLPGARLETHGNPVQAGIDMGKSWENQGNYGNNIQNNQVEWENLDLTWFNHHFMGFTTGYNGFYR